MMLQTSSESSEDEPPPDDGKEFRFNPEQLKKNLLEHRKTLVLIMTLFIGVPVAYFSGGSLLVLVFLGIWLDKIVLGFLRQFTPIEYVGIEIAFISSIAGGTIFGAVGAVFVFFSLLLLDGLRKWSISVTDKNPPYFPEFTTSLYALMAYVSWYFNEFSFVIVFTALLLIKYAILAVKDFILFGKPPLIIEWPLNFAISFYLAYEFAPFIATFVAAAA